MLYLNNKDALLAGFATAKCPGMYYGLHAGKLAVRVVRSFQKYNGEHTYSAVCVHCNYDSGSKLSREKAQAAGTEHVTTCTGAK